jgi:hypothetical protein
MPHWLQRSDWYSILRVFLTWSIAFICSVRSQPLGEASFSPPFHREDTGQEGKIKPRNGISHGFKNHNSTSLNSRHSQVIGYIILCSRDTLMTKI